jgi:hypothetical protein
MTGMCTAFWKALSWPSAIVNIRLGGWLLFLREYEDGKEAITPFAGLGLRTQTQPPNISRPYSCIAK